MSKIEWTDATWNPVTGCSRVSAGCDNCYMFAMYPRLKRQGVRGYETDPTDVRMFPDRINKPLSWTTPRRVFVNSMSDMFHRLVDHEFITQCMLVMEQAAQERGHIFQILTKRPGRAVAWWKTAQTWFDGKWPAGVWIGVSVENQKYAPRISVLARLPAPIKFVSAEPLIDRVDLSAYMERGETQWIIAGGESGPGARPMKLSWAADLRDQCNAAGVPYFLKQLGGEYRKRGGEEAQLDGQLWHEFPNEPKQTIKTARELGRLF